MHIKCIELFASKLRSPNLKLLKMYQNSNDH